MDPIVIVFFLVGSLLVLLGRAQPQVAVGIPNGFSYAWLLSFEPLLAAGPFFGLLVPTRFELAAAVGWLVVGLVCAVVGRLVTLQATALVSRVVNEPSSEGSSLPRGVRPEIVRYLEQVKEVDVDAVAARHDDACGRRRDRLRAVAEG